MNSEEYKKEETSRAKDLKGRLIEQLQEHVPDTFGNLGACLKRGLESIEAEREKLAIISTPLP